jgi:hypothetical protein
VKFDQLTKKNKKKFDQTPNLTENFDQLKRSSEIRSSECFPLTIFDICLDRVNIAISRVLGLDSQKNVGTFMPTGICNSSCAIFANFFSWEKI